tara:strand:+ start:299 stop:481 length:183 start_codon:yes stop_codon:yes gene_type:complete
MAKNRKKSSYLIGEISNPNTGEIISSYNKKIQQKVQIQTHYVKFIQDLLKETLTISMRVI